MKQMTFADVEYAGKRKQTRKELFLIEMDQVVPWKGLIALIEPHYPKGEGGRPAYQLMAMLRVHLMQNWFGYSDPAMEEALYETTILRQFAGLSLERIPDETTILNFRRMLEKHELAAGILAVINGYLGDRGWRCCISRPRPCCPPGFLVGSSHEQACAGEVPHDELDRVQRRPQTPRILDGLARCRPAVAGIAHRQERTASRLQ